MLAIIGGSGLYALQGLQLEQEHQVSTPFGDPSAPIFQGCFADQPVVFGPPWLTSCLSAERGKLSGQHLCLEKTGCETRGRNIRNRQFAPGN